MDSDFSHDPKYMPELFNLINDYDLVLGSRYVRDGKIENWGFIRRLISRFGSLYAQALLSLPIKDLTGGFKCWRREALEKINLDRISTRGYAFQIETTYRAFKNGSRILEFPIVFRDRRIGKTKMSKAIFIEAIFAVIKMKLKK